MILLKWWLWSSGRLATRIRFCRLYFVVIVMVCGFVEVVGYDEDGEVKEGGKRGRHSGGQFMALIVVVGVEEIGGAVGGCGRLLFGDSPERRLSRPE